MTPEERAAKLIEPLLQAQLSNVDPGDFGKIHNRWRFLIAEAIRAAEHEARAGAKRTAT